TNPGSSTTNPGSSTTNPGSSTTNPGTSTTDPGTSEDPETSAKTITYSVTADALTADDTMLVFKYNRSAAGAKELVIIENCGIVVKYNGTEIKTIDKLEFALDEYGAYFDGDRSEDTRKEYKIKVGIATKVKKGDTVVVEYKEGVGTITGEGKDAEAVKTLVVALIDTNEKAGYNEETQEGGYYKELAENVYRPLF
ncbi:MAG: hypothetical protein K2N58_07345, partial [Treponemataceae bacterium]|nr:hypothetical protein [Treponemataceae bacterium]